MPGVLTGGEATNVMRQTNTEAWAVLKSGGTYALFSTDVSIAWLRIVKMTSVNACGDGEMCLETIPSITVLVFRLMRRGSVISTL
jgi:hypothetical protein